MLPNQSDEPSVAERRSEPRYPTHEPAEIELQDIPDEPIYGTVLDVSRSGLRLALPQRIERCARVRVKLQQNVIIGEVRYCRAVLGGFHAGVQIQDLVRPAGHVDEHIGEDELALYAIGKGLSVTEVIKTREHLARCEACRTRVADKQSVLYPKRKARPYLLNPQPRA